MSNKDDQAPFQVKYESALDAQGWTIAYHMITRDSRISDGAHRLYLLLHQYAQQQGSAWPSRATLAQALGVSEATIKRRLQELTEVGLIERRKELFMGAYTTYLLNPNGKYAQLYPAAERVKNDPFGSERVKNDPSNGSFLTRHEESIEEEEEEEEERASEEEKNRATEIARVLEENGIFPEPAARIAARMARAGIEPEEALAIFLATLRRASRRPVPDEGAISRAVYRLERGVWDAGKRARQAMSRFAATAPPPVEDAEVLESEAVTNDPTWQAVLSDLELQMTRATFNAWLSCSRGLGWEGDTLIVQVATTTAQQWLDSRLRSVVLRALRSRKAEADVRFVARSADANAASPITPDNGGCR